MQEYTGTQGSGIFWSDNQGETWQAINEGLLYEDVYAVALLKDNVFAGTNGGYLFQTIKV